MKKWHADLFALAYAAYAQARSEQKDATLRLSSCLCITQSNDAQFACGEAQEASVQSPAAYFFETSVQTLNVTTALIPFSTLLGPLPEDLAADLMEDGAKSARDLCDAVYARVAGLWVESALNLRPGGALASEPEDLHAKAVPAALPAWSERISFCVAAGRAPHSQQRRTLRVLASTQPSAGDIVQLVGTLWRDAGLGDVPLRICAFAGSMQSLPASQRFVLGRARLSEQSVLGRRMRAVTSCCEVQVGPLDAAQLAAVDTHPTFYNDLCKELSALVPATQNVRVTFVLQKAAHAPLRLSAAAEPAAPRPTQRNRLGHRSFLRHQRAQARLLYLNLRAPQRAQQHQEVAVS